MLLCTVRGCHLPLAREEKRVVCPRGHSFDIARSGYFNLLQPQDRRSKQPGDTSEALSARRRLHDLGVTVPIMKAISELISPSPKHTLLDAGCGEGFYLGSIARETGCEAHGVDISVGAIELAAKRYPSCEWVVANADRFLPYADGTFSFAMSITGRMNCGEFARVLQAGGKLLIGLAAPDDLIELRGRGRDRFTRTVEAFAARFEPRKQQRVTTSAELSAGTVHDVLLSIYRPLQKRAIEAMRVTFSMDLLLFQRK
jgi:23S rRNA (guanine745-N1)-methyltransferase